jgi:hypothetical protein
LGRARTHLIGMRDSKRILREDVLTLKKQRSSIITDLKEEEHVYFETEMARRRLEEQHGATNELAKLSNAPIHQNASHRASSAATTFHSPHNALHSIRKHEVFERALMEARHNSNALNAAADALGKSV